MRAVYVSRRLSLVYDDSYEIARTDLELANDEDGAGTMSIIDFDMHMVFVMMRMMDYPGTVRYAPAIAWGRLMAGRPVRIPDATFPWRRIVTGRDMETSVAVLVEVRVMPTVLAVFPVVIAVGAPPFLAVLPVIITLSVLPIPVVSPFVVAVAVPAVLAIFPVVVSVLCVLPILVARPVVVAVAVPPILATLTVVLVLIAVLPILAAIPLLIVAAISPVLAMIFALLTLRRRIPVPVPRLP